MSRSASPFSSEEPADSAPARDAVLPLLDLAALHRLEEEVRELLACNFARDYIVMWESRCRRLVTGLTGPEGREMALDAAISIKVSSTMIGALRLAGLAADMEELIRVDALREAVSGLPALIQCGQATIQELQLRYCKAA